MELLNLQHAEQIHSLVHPPKPFTIYSASYRPTGDIGDVPVRTYTPDFHYQELTPAGEWVNIYEDHKGREIVTDIEKFVWLLVSHQYGVSIRVTYYSRGHIAYIL